jgi:hypothetical protein
MMRLIFIIAAALAVTAMPSAQAVPIEKALCQVNHAAITVSKAGHSTTSNGYVDVIETGVRFIQGGTKPGCIVVSFSAEAGAAANETMVVQPVLDGTTICEPGENFFVPSNTSVTHAGARAMNYVCRDVTPGVHRLKMQFRSFGGQIVTLSYRTLIVHHFK